MLPGQYPLQLSVRSSSMSRVLVPCTVETITMHEFRYSKWKACAKPMRQIKSSVTNVPSDCATCSVIRTNVLNIWDVSLRRESRRIQTKVTPQATMLGVGGLLDHKL